MVVIEHYIFSNLRSAAWGIATVCRAVKIIQEIFLRLFFISKGPLTIRGQTRELEKNYADIY